MFAISTSTNRATDAGALALSALASLPDVAILVFDRDFRYLVATGEVVGRDGWGREAL